MKSRTGLLCAILTLLTLVIIIPAGAQDIRGGINGRVTDSSGGLLPGVTVTVTNVETNLPAVTVTDAKGVYQVARLNSGKGADKRGKSLHRTAYPAGENGGQRVSLLGVCTRVDYQTYGPIAVD